MSDKAKNYLVWLDRELDEKDAEIRRLRRLVEAAKNLAEHNTEIAYRRLEAVLKEGR